MNCPRCGDAAMFERDREGITIDVCQKCRGIFLDRGELEKLIAFTTNDEGPPRDERGAMPPRPVHHERRDWEQEPPSSDFGRKRHPHQRREGFLSRLGDFFD